MKYLHKFPDRSLIIVAIAIWLLRWPLLQVVAWAGMLVDYSSTSGLRDGVRQTFDGEHPCSLCLAVESGIATETAWFSQALESPLPFAVLSAVLVVAAVLIRHRRKLRNEFSV